MFMFENEYEKTFELICMYQLHTEKNIYSQVQRL